MIKNSNFSDDSSESASPSPSAYVSIEEVGYNSPDPSTTTILQKQIESYIESYLKKKQIDPKAIEKTTTEFASELNKKNDEFVKKIEDKIIITEEKIQNSKQRVTETLGIFVALFTFVSVSFQIFDKVNNILQIVSLELILIGSLVLFILLLSLLMQSRKKSIVYDESFFENKSLLRILLEVVSAFGKKFILLVLNNGLVSFLLIFSILLIVGGAIGVFKSKKEYGQTEQKQLLSPIENNNSFNFMNEASSSSVVK